MHANCYFCHIKTIEKLIAKFQLSSNASEGFVFLMHRLLGENWDVDNPYLAREIHLLAKQLCNRSDLYSEEKSRANELLLGQYFYRKLQVTRSEDSFAFSAKLAVVGNIIDYGAHSVGADITQQTESLMGQNIVIDETAELLIAVQNAHSIVYLGDNAGEIVFDRLFIETMDHPNVTYVVRGGPVINDVTFDDAQHVGMDKVCKVISNGYDAPSTLLEHCSNDFLEVFNNADLIISKGQGNFEGLIDSMHPQIFFMLIAKCIPIAEMIGVQKDEMVITRIKQ